MTDHTTAQWVGREDPGRHPAPLPPRGLFFHRFRHWNRRQVSVEMVKRRGCHSLDLGGVTGIYTAVCEVRRAGPGPGLPKEEVDELYSLTHGSMLNINIQLGSIYRVRPT